MPIMNYTTKIDAHRTVGEIQRTLAKIGASNVSVDYSDGEPASLLFLLNLKDKYFSFRMPANWRGIYTLLVNDSMVAKALKTELQARNVAWRILQDWVESQLALIEAQLATPVEIFLPYLVAKDGLTLYQLLGDDRIKLIADG